MRTPARLTSEAEQGHRRGVVLGLTMAELLLLLLFCLLLASAGVLSVKDKQLAADEQEVADLTAVSPPASGDASELVQLRKRVVELTSLAPAALTGPIPDETWTELVDARKYIEQLKAAGVSPADVSDTPTISAVTELVQLVKSEGKTPDQLVAEIRQSFKAGHDWPPIITLGNDRFRFGLNSAELSPDFHQRLVTEVAGQVRDLLAKYQVDVVEVVGHTDEQPITSTQQSTLDTMAISALGGGRSIGDLKPADNAGLGLARAIAVANALRAGLPANVKIIPLSAAQLILPGDIVSDGKTGGDSPDRRRIEIRVRRSTGNLAP